MTTQPKVSVVIACHQYGRFLGEAIESALAQTVPVEVIVVDDGSTDDSVEVARRYTQSHGVTVAALPHGGVCLARNHGAKLARGEYLLFLDADDVLPPAYVERCLAALEAAPSNVAYAYTPMDLFGAETGRFESRPFSGEALLKGNIVHVSALLRREEFERAGGFDPELRLGYEDYDLWLRLLDRGFEGVFVPEVALRYRRHAQSRNSLSAEQLDALQKTLRRRYARLYARHEQPDISVVIVNWNSKDDLAACLRSLAAQTEVGFETVVVDNGSVDGSAAMMRTEFPWAVLVDARDNLGFAEGCNRGIAVARGEWIATLNNDAEAEPNWIAEQRAAIRAGGERLGMVQSKIVFRDRRDRTNSTGVLLFEDVTAIDRHYEAPLEDSTEPAEIFCSSAGASLYRRQMLDEIRLASGVFDRTFFMYFEDVDLGWRCRLGGWDAVYVPSAVVFHAFHGSASRRGRHFVALHCQRNRVRMMLKNGSPALVARGVPRTVRDLTWAVKIEGPRALGEYAVAIFDGLRQRAAVTKRSKVERRDVERRWLKKPGTKD